MIDAKLCQKKVFNTFTAILTIDTLHLVVTNRVSLIEFDRVSLNQRHQEENYSP